MCFFSVIIPTYNSAATIERCLDSVFRQAFGDFEILIVDGLSTDETIAITQKYSKDKRIKIISEKDKGIYDAMNKGIIKSAGKWIYFLGSDDEVIDEDVFSEVHKTIVDNGQAKFVYGNVITTDNVVEKYTNYKFRDLLSRCICHQCIFYDRTLFSNMLYDLQYKICADWDFNLKIYRKNIHPIYIDRIIAKFNLSGVSGQWMHHPEYLAHFANRRVLVKRYRGRVYLYGYYLPSRLTQKIRSRLLWMFQ